MASTTESKSGASVCPPGAPGSVPPGPYTPKGSDMKLGGDLPVYVVGDRANVGVIVAQEIFGIESGRLKQICDTIAAAGFVVCMADYHRGTNFDTIGKDWSKIGGWLNGTPWSKIQSDIDTHLIPLLQSRGATKFGAVGFCWGSWLVFHLADTGKLAAGCYAHPSHRKLAGIYGENPDDLVKGSKCPILAYAAGDDGPDVKPGGTDEKLLEAKFPGKNEFKEWPDVKHGFTTRIPFDQDQTGRDYPLAMQGIIAFLKKHTSS